MAARFLFGKNITQFPDGGDWTSFRQIYFFLSCHKSKSAAPAKYP
jgi:hypothetical protein